MTTVYNTKLLSKKNKSIYMSPLVFLFNFTLQCCHFLMFLFFHDLLIVKLPSSTVSPLVS